MPVPMNAATSPLQVISNMFDARSPEVSWEKQVQDYFKLELDKPDVLANVTSLNNVANHVLFDGQLVRFRCMVQDMFDPEMYMSEYQVKNMKDGSVSVRSGRYRDVVQCGLGEEVIDTGDSDIKERQCLYCVSPPGESGWVTDGYRKLTRDCHVPGPSGTQENNMKRSLDDNTETSDDMDTETETDVINGTVEGSKKQKSNEVQTEINTKKAVKPPNNLNLPLPSSNGKACIVKLYDIRDGDIKLQDLLEFVGIISLDPAMAAGDEEDDSMMSTSPSLPPPSLVPRLHVLHFTKLSHNNPMIPQENIPPVQEVARVELLTLLTSCLLGDKLAADYLLLHLISKVYMRKDVLVLGKLSLNLHNMTNHQEWPKRLSTILSLLTTNSHYLPLSRNSLDSVPFAPRKDYEANRLVSGKLKMTMA